jgi:hypothetical protein
MTRDQGMEGESSAVLCEASRAEDTTARVVVRAMGGVGAVVVCKRC